MADRYWVGGTANWDGTAGTKWAATSGGLGGETVPTTADDVFFDASSTGTCTISAGNTGAKSINCTGFTGTIAGTAAITVAGSVTLDAGQTYTHTGTITFTGTGTLTTAGKTFSGVTVNGSGITLTLGDALNTATRNITITQGTFDTANYNVTSNSLSSSNSNTRTITFGSSTVTLSSTGPIVFTTSANLTFNANTSQINCSSQVATINGGSQTFYNVSFTSTSAGTRSISGANTFNDLTLNASAPELSQLSIAADQTVNGTFTCAGTSVTQRGFVRSDTIGTTRTITAAVVSADDCDFRDITIAGAASPISPTRAGDCGGNTNITFPAAKTVYRVGTNTTWVGSNSWALTSGGTGSNANLPLAQDTAVIDNSTTLTGTLFTAPYNIGAIDASTRTTGITFGHTSTTTIYGSYTLGSGVTISGTSVQTFSGRGTMTFTSAGKTITFPITVDAPGGTFQLGDAFSGSSSITHTRGTFDANDYNLTCTTFASNNTNTRTITMGSGLWTVSATSGTVWDTRTATGLTLNKNTADILLSGNVNSATRTFRGGNNISFNKVTIGGVTATSTVTEFANGVSSFEELASTKTVSHTVRFGDSQTIGTWSITGTSGNVVTVNSDTAGTARTLTKSGGGFLTGIDYLDVRDVVGSPVSDTWYIGANSVYNTTAPNTARGFFLTQRADNAVIVLDSTTSSSWTVPSDWNNSSNTIHLIGGGGGGRNGASSGNNRAGGGGGGGGGYTQLTNQTLTIGASITYQAGAEGTAGANGSTTSWNSGAATAGGGQAGQASTTPSSSGGAGGTGSTYNGGNGGAGAFGIAASTGYGGGGGGGAAGPNGAGGNGGDGFASTTDANIAGGGGGGNGGGSNGGNASSATGGTGGNNSLGTGGGASNTSGVNGGGGGGSVGITSTSGGFGRDIFGTGSGGGVGGGATSNIATFAGFYGGGGGGAGVTIAGTARVAGSGRQGAIIITYVPGGAVTPTGNMFFMFN